MPACRPSFNLGFPNMKCSYPSATLGIALNKSGESIGEVWYGTVQDWRVKVRFVMALYKTGGWRWGLLWHCTRLEGEGEVCCGTVQDWRVRWSLMWHCTRLEGEGEVCCGTVQDWRVRWSWCGTVQDWRVKVRFDVALYKTGGESEVFCGTVQDWRVRWSLVWHCTTLESEVKFDVALYKTGEWRWGLVWHCTRLESTHEFWCDTIQEWKVQVRFCVALYNTRNFEWGSRVVNRSCPSSFTPYPWNAYPMKSVLKLVSSHFWAHSYMYSNCEHLIATDSSF